MINASGALLTARQILCIQVSVVLFFAALLVAEQCIIGWAKRRADRRSRGISA